jgi:hypothetical protein
MAKRYFFFVLFLAVLLVPAVSFAKNKKETGITCEVTTSKTVIAPGESIVISWVSYGAILAYGPSGERVRLSGSETVTPTKKTIYKFKFLNTSGNEKCGVRVRIQGEKVPD